MSQRILITKDDVEMAKLISRMLEASGYSTVIANDGVEAVSKLMGGNIDLIILDIMMPFFSGYWFCNIFKGHPATKNIPVVIVSALNKRSDIEKGMRLGADAYVTKPFEEGEFVDVVKSVFKKKGMKSKSRN
jgi:CheY-like chemotaxis protein